MSLQIQKYTDKSIVIRGETKIRLADIKAISGAKFGYFGGEPGWMFPLTMEQQVRAALKIGEGYVDGPKPLNRGTAPSQTSSGTSDNISSLLLSKSTVTKPPVRGGLRGGPIIDPEEKEKEEAHEIELLKVSVAGLLSTITELKNENATLHSSLNDLRVQLVTLSNRLDEVTFEESVVLNE